MVPKYWNVNTGVFLRRYVYERVGKGFAGLAVTQLVSGLWHGLREGHMIFFFMTIFLFQGSKGALHCPRHMHCTLFVPRSTTRTAARVSASSDWSAS